MKTKKQKITCIIHALTLGGMERVMALLLTDFAQRENVEVSLVLIGKERQIDFELPPNIHIIRPPFQFNPKQRSKSTLKTLLFIRKTIKGLKPDTVLSFGEYWNNLVLLALYGLKTPVFISDRSQPNKNLGKLQNTLKNRLYPTAAGYIVQTEKAKKIAQEKKWNKHIEVIGNPIREILPYPEIKKENIVLTVGRLIKTKHIDQLIRIFENCKQNNWKLVVVGGNAKQLNLLEEYRAMVKKASLDDKIKLVGPQKNVDQYYRKSKLFAFTSSSEGFPNVIGEAMAAGLPVIAYDCMAGPSEMIENEKTGYLIPEREEEMFRQKLRYLMQKEDIRDEMSQQAAIKIQEFQVAKIAQKFYAFITR